MITEDWARQQIEGLLPRLEMAKAQAAEAERKIAGIREIIRGVLIMYPELAEEVPDDLEGGRRDMTDPPRGRRPVHRLDDGG